MTKLSDEVLSDWLAQAANQVKVGGKYKHYKNPVKTYTVTDFVILESTDEPAVVYQANYGQNIKYVRTLKEWLEHVEHNGVQVSRFELAGESQQAAA